MIHFLNQLRDRVADFQISGKRVLVGVSGGADSVALLCGLAELRSEFGYHLTVAHLDHMLRGGASAADAVWVQALSDRWDVPCIREEFDVQAQHRDTKQTLEEAARQARYDFFQRAASEQHCTELAVAHTADDQAETVLHHILRGTGLAGLRGIPAERRLTPELRLIRPLLEIRRSEIESWLAERSQDFRHDETNCDPAFTRNRLRHRLLPLLEAEFNPQLIPALLRLGQQAGETEDVLTHFAELHLQSALRESSSERCRLDCEALAMKPLAFRRVCLIQLWRQHAWPRQRMTFGHWNQLAELIEKRRGALSLPHGLSARRQQDGLTVEWKPK